MQVCHVGFKSREDHGGDLTPVRFLLLLGLSGVVLATLGRAFSFPPLFAIGVLWTGAAGVALYAVAWLWLYDKTRKAA